MKKILLFLIFVSAVAQAQIVNIPDANFKNALLITDLASSVAGDNSGPIIVDADGDGEIQVGEAAAVTNLELSGLNITDLEGIESFTNLQLLNCSSNSCEDFHLSGLPALAILTIGGNYSLGNTAYSFNNLPSLQTFYFQSSNATSISVLNAPALTTFTAYFNADLTTLHLEGLDVVKTVQANDGNISDLSILACPLLEELNVNNNNLSAITTVGLSQLKKLEFSGNLLTDMSAFSNLTLLERLNMSGNQISTFALPNSPLLNFLLCDANGLSTLDVSGFANLKALSVTSNSLSTLDLSNNPLLEQLHVDGNSISALDVSNMPNLFTVSFSSTLISEMDCSQNPLLTSIGFDNNPNLAHINLKNGIVNTASAGNAVWYGSSDYYNLSNMLYICVDDGDEYNYASGTTPPAIPVTTYCDFVPGGLYNTITGTELFDADNNGCDALDTPMPFMKLKIDDGSVAGAAFTSTTGNYTFYTQAGNYEVTPQVENPGFFNITPAFAAVNFPAVDSSVSTNNFCISANGVHPDLEVVIAPVLGSIPGMDATYKVVYRNKGSVSESGTVTFSFDNLTAGFISAVPSPTSETGGALTWDYTNLLPFESRAVLITLNVNAPTDTPAVNNGDILDFEAGISPVADDEIPADNTFAFSQTVVGSFDPNDKKCIEGDMVSTDEIGRYLHYAVNFENTGTAPAQNIVVKDVINEEQFDVASLQVMDSSAPVEVKVTGNVAEFIFHNIELYSGGHGNILLKIKTLDSLHDGDIVSNQADIYFDYNYPIVTPTANTTFSELAVKDIELDESVSVYPNPARGSITIKAVSNISAADVYDLSGRLVQAKLSSGNEVKMDVSALGAGVYFVKVSTQKGTATQKMILE
jgi:hypothetical protein